MLSSECLQSGQLGDTRTGVERYEAGGEDAMFVVTAVHLVEGKVVRIFVSEAALTHASITTDAVWIRQKKPLFFTL